MPTCTDCDAFRADLSKAQTENARLVERIDALEQDFINLSNK